MRQYKQVYFFKSGDILLHCFPLFFSKLWKVCFSNFKPHWDTRHCTTQIQERDIEKGVEGRRRIVSKLVKEVVGFFSAQWKSFVLGQINNVKQSETKHVSSRVPKENLCIKKKKDALRCCAFTMIKKIKNFKKVSTESSPTRNQNNKLNS